MADYIDIYRQYIKTELAAKAQYRANTILWLIGLLFEPIIYLTVWSNVANAQGGAIEGFTAAAFAGYYLVLLFVRQATIAPGPWDQAYRIRTGMMSGVLLRPIHPMHYDLVESNTQKVTSLFVLIPIMIAIGFLFQARIAPPLWSAMAFIPALILAALLRFFYQYAFSMVAFWTDRIDGMWQVYMTMQTFLGGILAPLVLMPHPIQTLAALLPFRWALSFPVELAMGLLSPSEALIGFAAQAAWLVVSIVLMEFGWRMGVRKFGAYGG